jgi:hypothetical protein
VKHSHHEKGDIKDVMEERLWWGIEETQLVFSVWFLLEF